MKIHSHVHCHLQTTLWDLTRKGKPEIVIWSEECAYWRMKEVWCEYQLQNWQRFISVSSKCSEPTIDSLRKGTLYKTIVTPTGICASGTWKIAARQVEIVNVFRHFLPAHITHCHMSELLMKIFYYEVAPQDCKTSWQKVNMLSGHVLLLPGQGHPKTAMWWRPAGG